ncbi:MAG: hypothetical protein LBL26_09465 [Peptococcaceae bacterium]|jgi:hypothetical protein|nr:hypothetical protein [Peptococcaceae bacterium]
MIYAILTRLRQDAPLQALLGATEDDTRVYPLETGNFGPCLTYTVSQVSGGVVKTSRIETRIYDTDYDHALCVAARLDQLLDMDEGDPGWFFDYEDDVGASRRVEIMTLGQNGGGELLFTAGEQTIYQKTLYYYVKWRQIK